MIFHDLEDAIFLERLNRFAARVIYRGDEVLCHVPNSGRLRELLVHGVRLRVRPALTERKTKCSMLMVHYQGEWVVIDAHFTNTLFHEALLAEELEAFQGLTDVKREITFQKSRFDFVYTKDDKVSFVEIKCGTLVEEDGIARFPDAPTTRGTKHVKELISAMDAGFGAHVVFIIQNPLAKGFSPNYKMDPDFCAAVEEAYARGVQIHAYLCKTNANTISIKSSLDVYLR